MQRIRVTVLILTGLFFFSAFTAFAENTEMTTPTTIVLPVPDLAQDSPLERTISERRSVRRFSADSIVLSAVSQLLWSAQGITDSVEQFRAAPSAGALYPLEVYVLASRVTGLSPGLYKYHPEKHTLDLVSSENLQPPLTNAALRQASIEQAGAVFIITAVYSRTAVKYGDRAERYVHMEVGHAAQNVCLQATALDLGIVTVGAFRDDRVKSVLDLPDNEAPLYLLPVGR